MSKPFNARRLFGKRLLVAVPVAAASLLSLEAEEAHHITVEADKAEQERGKYLHPAEHGQPEERGLDYEQR